MNHAPMITIQDLSLEYELHYDRTSTFKEFVVNALSRRSYVDKKKDMLLVLNSLNLEVKEGERVGIVGFNGAGKSTLLKVVAGILNPTCGKLTVRGAVQPLIEIGAGFNPEFSGRENIYFNSYMLGFTKAQVEERVQEIIDFSELEKFIDVPVKYYSSGMQVRLAFTIATSIRPEVLILDEMLGAGDVSFIDKAKRRMQSLIDDAKCMMMVSHDLGLIESLCTRAIFLNGGEVAMDGIPREVIAEYRRIANVPA